MKGKGEMEKEKNLSTELAVVIAAGIVSLQVWATKALQRLDRRLSLRQKRVLLLVFIVAGTCYTGSLLYQAAFSAEQPVKLGLANLGPPVIPPPGYPAADSTRQFKK